MRSRCLKSRTSGRAGSQAGCDAGWTSRRRSCTARRSSSSTSRPIGLDPQSRGALWGYLRQLSREGTTIFLTTQYLEEADRACDRVAIIDGGWLVKEGTPAALKEEVGEGRLRLTLANGADPARAARALAVCPEVVNVEPGDPLVAGVRSVGPSLAPVIRLLDEAGIGVAGVETEQATLDDVFLRYTGQAPRAEALVASSVSSLFAAAHGRRRR
jgi:hypothetical protein